MPTRAIDHLEVLDDFVLGAVGIIVRSDMADGFGANGLGMLAEIDGGVRIDRADVHHHRHAMLHLLDDNLGNFLPFLRRHRRPLAVRTQDKKRMHAAGDKPVGELAHEFLIDAAIFAETPSDSAKRCRVLLSIMKSSSILQCTFGGLCANYDESYS